MDKGEFVMKNWILSTLTIAIFSGCGFGGKDADPLRGQTADEFVSQSEKRAEHLEWEEKFNAETAAYQDSVKSIQAKSDQKIQELEARYQTLEQQLRGQVSASQSQWEQERNGFLAEFNNYKKEQDQVIASIKSISQQWEDQANFYKKIVENPDKQNFQGMLYRFNVASSLPRSIEWTVSQEASHDIFLKMDFGQEALTGLRVQPDLPAGLKLVRKSTDQWRIEGSPKISFNPNQGVYRSSHYIVPVFDLKKVKDAGTRSLVSQQRFEEQLMIVVHEKNIPSVEGTVTQLSSSNAVLKKD